MKVGYQSATENSLIVSKESTDKGFNAPLTFSFIAFGAFFLAALMYSSSTSLRAPSSKLQLRSTI